MIKDILRINGMFLEQTVFLLRKFDYDAVVLDADYRNGIIKESMMIRAQNQHIGVDVQSIMVTAKRS